MMRWFLLSIAAGAALCTAPAVAQTVAEQQRMVETSLQSAVTFDGKPDAWTLEARMARWKVPGVSVAVVDGGRIVWAKGYGVLVADRPAPIMPSTRFQAASISKPIAAVTALSLVEIGKLTLDGDVRAVLKSWRLPPSAFTAEQPATLRGLLSHTAGINVHGFPGYAQGVPVPTLVQLLDGAPSANTKAIVSETKPGARYRYSGGGYQIAQQMIEDVTGRPFGEIVQARVLAPVGMADSGYDRPPAGAFAYGHDIGGQPIAGGWHTYPEAAAAGLWTTPSDLARFGLALAAAYRGGTAGPLTPAMTRTMLTTVKDEYGLGMSVMGEGDALAVSHAGSNEGFRTFWVMHPLTGDGVAVMTNGEAGDRVMMEIARAVAKTYGWPDFAPVAYSRFALAPEVLAGWEGDWFVDIEGQHVVFTLRRADGGLDIDTGQGSYVFTPVSASTLVSADRGIHAAFETGADGKPVLKVFGLEMRKAKPPLTP